MISRWASGTFAIGLLLASADLVSGALILRDVEALDGGSRADSTETCGSGSVWLVSQEEDSAHVPGLEGAMSQPSPTGGAERGGAERGVPSALRGEPVPEAVKVSWLTFYFVAFLPDPPPFRLLRPPRRTLPEA